jgi:hypothetical protein
VDFQFPISDRDEANGFLLFEYRDPQGRTYHASLELVAVTRDGQTTVRVVTNVPSMPSYVEAQLIDRLESKLRQDFGAPLRRTREVEQPPREDEAPVSGTPSDPAAPIETPSAS